MVGTVGPVTTFTTACVLALGMFGLRGRHHPPTPPADTQPATKQPAPVARLPVVLKRLPGNVLWTPLRAASLHADARCARPVKPTVVIEVEPPSVEANLSELAPSKDEVAPIEVVEPAQSEPTEAAPEQPSGVPAATEAQEPAAVQDPHPKALGTSHEVLDAQPAPGITQVNHLTDQLVGLVGSSSATQQGTEEVLARALSQAGMAAAEAWRFAEATVESALRDAAARAGVEPESLTPHAGIVLSLAFVADFLLLVFGASLCRRCRARRSPRSASAAPAAAEEQEEVEEQAADCNAAAEECLAAETLAKQALEEMELIAREAKEAKETKGAASQQDGVMRSLPSPIRVRGSRPTSFSTEDLGDDDEPAQGEETPTSPIEPSMPIAPPALQVVGEQAEEEEAKDEKEEQEEQEEEPAVEDPSLVTPTASSVVRRDGFDLAEVMRKRRDACEVVESKPTQCTADTHADKAFAVQAAPPAAAPELMQHSPAKRRGRDDLMELMRRRRENCEEFASKPDACSADVLQGAEAVPVQSQREARAEALNNSPGQPKRRDAKDLQEVMRRKRESCEIFTEVSPASSAVRKAEEANKGSPEPRQSTPKVLEDTSPEVPSLPGHVAEVEDLRQEFATEAKEEAAAQAVDVLLAQAMQQAPAEAAEEPPAQAVDEVPAEAVQQAPAGAVEESLAESVEEVPVQAAEEEEAPAEVVEDPVAPAREELRAEAEEEPIVPAQEELQAVAEEVALAGAPEDQESENAQEEAEDEALVGAVDDGQPLAAMGQAVEEEPEDRRDEAMSEIPLDSDADAAECVATGSVTEAVSEIPLDSDAEGAEGVVAGSVTEAMSEIPLDSDADANEGVAVGSAYSEIPLDSDADADAVEGVAVVAAEEPAEAAPEENVLSPAAGAGGKSLLDYLPMEPAEADASFDSPGDREVAAMLREEVAAVVDAADEDAASGISIEDERREAREEGEEGESEAEAAAAPQSGHAGEAAAGELSESEP